MTAGPTHEPIDPVRFIGNRSSGLMGFCLAEEAANRGAEVILIAGPTNIRTATKGIKRIDVQTAEEMYEASMLFFQNVDIAVLSAAVADFTPIKVSKSKIKKEDVAGNGCDFFIELRKTKDILATMGERKRNDQVVVGFALETDNIVENATKKLITKKADFIVMNSATDKGAGFGVETNKIAIIDSFGNVSDFDMKSKKEVAVDIFNHIGF